MPPPTARDLAADLLVAEERGGAWVKDLLPAARSGLVDPRDRALLTELAYGVVRRRGTLDALLAAHSRRPPDSLARAVRVGIRLALYQVLFLDRIPVHAAVDQAVAWVRGRAGARAGGYANAVLRSAARQVEGLARGEEDARRDVPRDDGSALRLAAPLFPDPAFDLAGNLSLRFSCPRWLVERWIAERGGARTRAILHASVARPPLALRARGDREALLAALQADGMTVRRAAVETALLVEDGGEGPALAAVDRGEAWVQDPTAQRVAPLLAPRPGQRLLDLCAAPGGKALHLADLLGPGGTVVACDVSPDRTARLEALRAQVPPGVGLEVALVPREGPLAFAPASFDGILVDAPCTNTGVLRRRVEARWRLAPEDVPALARLQRDLLERAWPLLRPGGTLVYATCSLEPEENEGVVAAFLADHPQAGRGRVLEVPSGTDQDGGFAVQLVSDRARA